MNERLKSNAEERPNFIIIGIVSLYLLIAGFIYYLFFLHRISLLSSCICAVLFTIIYIPRFLIINKLRNKDKIQILDDCMLINDVGVYFNEIKSFTVEEKKPQVIFFMNNSMVLFNEAKFCIELQTEKIAFTAIGSEKIKLLKEFLSNVIR